MKRFYDHLLRQDPIALCDANFLPLHAALAGAQQFDITNVADYYNLDTDQEDWRPSRDLPNLAPPYPACWFEYPLPAEIHGVGTVIVNSDHRGRYGVLVAAADLSKGERPARREAALHI